MTANFCMPTILLCGCGWIYVCTYVYAGAEPCDDDTEDWSCDIGSHCGGLGEKVLDFDFVKKVEMCFSALGNEEWLLANLYK
jgi:hypothetical protein